MLMNISLKEYKAMFEEQERMGKVAQYNTVGASIHQVTFRNQIEMEIDRLEEALSKKKEMLQLLSENPAIEKFMNLSRGI